MKSLRVLILVACCSILLPVARAQSSVCEAGNGELNEDPPKGVEPASLIPRFAANEAVLKKALEGYTFSLDMLVQTWGDTGPSGEYRRKSDISYDGKSKPQEHITFQSVSTLKGIAVDEDDFQDARDGAMAFLTPEHLNEYFINYVGQQPVDQLLTYVFDVAPKKEHKNGLFQGKIWVDNKDLVIVKTCGQIMREPTTVRNGRGFTRTANVSPTTATYREQIDGKFWFPSYSRVDENEQFRNGDVYIKQTIKRTNYKKTGA
jgi:hypothetical protein